MINNPPEAPLPPPAPPKSDNYIVGMCGTDVSFTLHIEGNDKDRRETLTNIIKTLELYKSYHIDPVLNAKYEMAKQQAVASGVIGKGAIPDGDYYSRNPIMHGRLTYE